MTILKKIGFIWGLSLIALVGTACNDDETSEITVVNNYPLNAFAVGVYSSASSATTYYHANIDQTTHNVVIGTLERSSTITSVTYTLAEGATIQPDPSTFIGNWAERQNVTVTTADGASTTYTVVLSKFTEEEPEPLFYDDFDTDGIPDESKWVLCPRDVSDWNDEMSESYDQAYVENGVLVLKGEQVNGEYKSGGIKTEGKFDFTFGKVEVRARISSYPNGAFPAIWMMPSQWIYNGWPQCGEIDIMEHIKQDAGIYSSIHNGYYDTFGYDNPSHTGYIWVDNIADFHVYAVTWTAEALTFSIDGTDTFTYPNLHLENEAEMMQWPFTADSKFYLILNMGLGGDRPGSWPGPIDDANLPAVMEVDWVKIWALDE